MKPETIWLCFRIVLVLLVALSLFGLGLQEGMAHETMPTRPTIEDVKAIVAILVMLGIIVMLVIAR